MFMLSNVYFFSFWCMVPAPPFDFILHSQEVFEADDWLMCFLGMILWQLAVVQNRSLCDMVFPIVFLKEKVSGITVIPKHTENPVVTPVIAKPGFNTFIIQFICNPIHSFSGEVVAEDPANDFCLFGVNHIFPVTVSVPEQRSVPGFAVFELPLDSPLLILTY